MNERQDNSKMAALEALLFHYGEPLAVKKAATLLEMEETEASALAEALMEKLGADAASGLMLLRNGDALQLVTKPELKNMAEAIVQDEFREELTPASLETLSLVAYLGPVSRPTIDYVRGVNSSFTMRSLLMRGLVERFHPETGHAYEYRVSFDFLKHMGLDDVRHLPDYEKYRDILKKFEEQETKPEEVPHNTEGLTENTAESTGAEEEAGVPPAVPEEEAH